MLELPISSREPSSIDVTRIDDRTDEELDTLPFGVVALDEQGVILRYNLYESRLARLDRNQVLGRVFFDDVAPCTQNDSFLGRFRRGVESGLSGSLVRFPFLFDFRFGAQEVEVEIVKPANAPRYYLLINRRRVGPPRPDKGPRDVAVLQRELAPDEAALGVRRDPYERRVLEVPWAFLAALRATCEHLAPESWQLFCAEWGTQLGRRLAVDLESAALEDAAESLGELPMARVAELLSGRLAEMGWGRATLDFSALADGVLVVDVVRSALAEAAPKTRAGDRGRRTDLACPLLAGTLGAMFSHVASRRLSAREVACSSAGAPACQFVLTSHGRRRQLDAVTEKGVRGAAAVLAALRQDAHAEVHDD